MTQVPIASAPVDALTFEFSLNEVNEAMKLRRESAPGNDTVTFRDLRVIDPDLICLTAIFNQCLKLRNVPANWKTSSTILIFKKGNKRNINNWRPISVAPCIYRLYTALLANRLRTWLVLNNKINKNQKGFMPTNGALEHSYLLKSILDQRRGKHDGLAVAWLDLSNAFPSMPHDHLFRCLNETGVGDHFLGVVKDLYTNAKTSVRLNRTSWSSEININRGVLQGDPLSPVLFNLGIEPIIRDLADHEDTGYSLNNGNISVPILAYADDLVVLAATKPKLQSALNTAVEKAALLGLNFNADKCASLCFKKGRSPPTDEQLEINGKYIQAVRKDKPYLYLGIPIGSRTFVPVPKEVKALRGLIMNLDSSLLAPWQKLTAFRTFIQPRLLHILCHGAIYRKYLEKLDTFIRKIVKKWLYLPTRAATEIVKISPKNGGAGILPFHDLLDVQRITTALKVLNSNDPSVRATALYQLKDITKRWTGKTNDINVVLRFLNGDTTGEFCGASGPSNEWTFTRKASRSLSKKLDSFQWQFSAARNEFAICATVDNETIIAPERAAGLTHHLLRILIQQQALLDIKNKPDQGKVLKLTSNNRECNDFIREGRHLNFKDWRFVFKARLNLLPVNGAQKNGDVDKRCRRCGHNSETLPHVINHCRPALHLITERHNKILERLVRTIKLDGDQRLRINQTVTESSSNVRPDIVLSSASAKEFIIIDVAVTFENGNDAFNTIKRLKEDKYRMLIEELANLGYSVKFYTFAIGSLGGWASYNSETASALKICTKYVRKMKKLMCTDSIRFSRKIYTRHVQEDLGGTDRTGITTSLLTEDTSQ